MKKLSATVLLFCLTMALAACQSQGGVVSSPRPVQQEMDEWPQNEYTAAVPEPEYGVPFSAVSDQKGGYTVSLTGATREQGERYVQQLKQDGFTVIEQNSENAATGVLLEKEDVSVSVAVSDTGFSIYIALED